MLFQIVKSTFLVLLIIFAGVTIGTAFAVTPISDAIISGFLVVNGPTQINDILVVDGPEMIITNGTLKLERTDGGQSAIRVLNDVGQTLFLFEDTDDNRTYFMRYTLNGTLFDFGSVLPTPTNDLAIDTVNSRIGIGTITPAEKLEVMGNIKLSGNIMSDGDICIGSCP